MLKLNCCSEVFCDGLLFDQGGYLMFMSVWGRDTSLQELLARLTLDQHPDAITSFKANSVTSSERFTVSVPNASVLEKQTARAPKHSLLGDLVQLFIYDKALVKPDLMTRKAWSIYQRDTAFSDSPRSQERDLWPLIKTTCHLPLLDAWREPVIAAFTEQGWISVLEGYLVGAIGVDLSAGVDQCIEALITSNVLTLNGE